MRRPPTTHDELVSQLFEVYREADALYAGASCPASTECCRFGITGREPYVTSIELAALKRAIAVRGGLRSWKRAPVASRDPSGASTSGVRLPVVAEERTCPMLDASGRCAVYDARLGELVELLELHAIIKKPVRTLSLGERMKCELVAALLHGPEVLFLDEPTIGMDVSMQLAIREFLAEAKSDLDWATVSSGGFSPLETASFIESSFLRRVFMKAAVAMVWADNVYTDNERRAIGEFADAFGLNNAEFGEIEQEAKRVDLAAAG